jgi:hypothetical protein
MVKTNFDKRKLTLKVEQNTIKHLRHASFATIEAVTPYFLTSGCIVSAKHVLVLDLPNTPHKCN